MEPQYRARRAAVPARQAATGQDSPYVDPAVLRPIQFSLVGGSGLVLNQLLLVAFTEIGAFHYLASALIATQCSSTWNFALANRWVFADRSARHPALVRLLQCLTTNNAMLLGRGPLMFAMTECLGFHYLISNLVTLLIFFALRYVLADRWIWAPVESRVGRAVFYYDIHGIIRIVSETCLPELSYFQKAEPLEQTDLRVVVVGLIGGKHSTTGQSGHATDCFHYQDAPWWFGFGVEIQNGDSIEVRVSPILRYSTHVLYTNVVEPVLRWMLVQRGYSLMHGACVTLDDRAALLITARTDTGKTSTILHLLAHSSFGFLSDDMVILRPNGTALCYPKPLTISCHTLEALNGTANLSRTERLALQLQSRVHSRSGRSIAFFLTRLPVPVATINALVQMVIPPPKYAVVRLVPGARVVHEATITRRVEIVRGPDGELSLGRGSAQQLALEDCEDAYGFPPYPALEPFLSEMGGQDLREIERRIIGHALHGCRTMLLSRHRRNWWPRIFEWCVHSAEAAGASRTRARISA